MHPSTTPPHWWRTFWVCCCGEQALPNVLPMLAHLPERVLLLHSERTQEAARQTQAVLLARKVPDVTLVPVDPYSIADVRKKIRDACTGFAEEDILVNWTGGTKPMALAAYQALPKATRLYYEVGRGFLVDDGPFVEETVGDASLTLKDLATIAGARLQVGASSCPGDRTIEVIERLAKADPANLWRLQRAKRKGTGKRGDGILQRGHFSPGDFGFRDEGLTGAFARAMCNDELAEPPPRGSDRYTLTEAGKRFLRGFWWEQFVSSALRNALRTAGHPAGDEVFLANADVFWRGNTPEEKGKNEIDTLFILRNRLCVVTVGSVPTASDAKVKRDEALSEAQRLGGTFSKVIVATILDKRQLHLVRTGFDPHRILVPHYDEWHDPTRLVEALAR